MTTEYIFHVTFWILVGGVLIMRMYFALRVRRAGERVMPDRQAVEREGRGMFTVRVFMFLLLLGWIALYAINRPWMGKFAVPFPSWLRWVGFALGIASLVFWTWTQVALGRNWSPQLQLREEHHLVTSGPYARIRHPLYTAMFGYGASIALVTANWVFVILTAAMIVAIIARIPREERMMIDKFGEEYKVYMKRTGRFFPK
jgi:protein-S-isoprenylcysteine O-methyltransferase Ste14